MRRWRNSHRSNHAAGRLFSAVAQCAVAGRQRPGGPAPRGAVQPALSQPGATDRLLHRHDAERPAAVARTPEDGAILVLPGVGDSQRYFAGEEAEQARRWLATLRPDLQQQRITLVCICSGALLAAQAGLLDGYQCTTHHDVIERIRRQAPAAQVKENRIFVEDRGVYTSAGITTGIDLALHRSIATAAPAGRATSPAIWWSISAAPGTIRSCRPAALPQPPAPGGAPRAGRDGRRAGGRLVGAAGGGKARQQPPPARLFRSHVGISVREYHEQLRLAVAQQRLQQGYGLEKAALAAGFFRATAAPRPAAPAFAAMTPAGGYPAAAGRQTAAG